MASNKHFDLRKIENFVRSKYCHEDIAKDKGKKLISENLVIISTAWKVFKYGVISGPCFPVFGRTTEIYRVNLRIQPE